MGRINFFMGSQFVFLFIVYVVAQVYLSRRENNYLGLFLPLVTLLRSLYVGVFWRSRHSMMHSYRYGGGLWAFVIANITTLVLIFIYVHERKKLGMATVFDDFNKDKDPLETKITKDNDAIETKRNTEEELERMDALEKMDLED